MMYPPVSVSYLKPLIRVSVIDFIPSHSVDQISGNPNETCVGFVYAVLDFGKVVYLF